MLVSPAEPPALRALGETSSVPETMGADFLLFTSNGLVAVQRKRVDDLVASVHDGRLQKELGQIACADLYRAVLVVEGSWQFGANGRALAIRHGNWNRKSWHGIELAVQHAGLWLVTTDTLDDTADWLAQAEVWFSKADHVSMSTRPKIPRGAWDDPQKHFMLRVLQSFDGISVKTAGAIIDKADEDGVQLLDWLVNEKWLLSVDGVGKKRASVLAGAFERRTG